MNAKRNLVQVVSIAARYSVPAKWIIAEADAGRIPCLRAGGELLFDPVAVERAFVKRAARCDPKTPDDKR